MSGMDELEQAWPDDDRRDDALERLAAVVKHAEEIWPLRHAQFFGDDTVPEGSAGLDDRDRHILQGLSSGLRMAEVADVLGIPLETVKSRLKKEKRLLRAKTGMQLVANALRTGFIT